MVLDIKEGRTPLACKGGSSVIGDFEIPSTPKSWVPNKLREGERGKPSFA